MASVLIVDDEICSAFKLFLCLATTLLLTLALPAWADPESAEPSKSESFQPGTTGEPAASSGSKPAAKSPEVRDLGDGRYGIGAIEIDAAKGRFSVPAVVIRLEPPLEFLAIIKDGFKAYESVLEIQADAYQFNLACILIGLDPERGKAVRYHFDPEEPEGYAVELWVEWEVEGETRRIEAADLIKLGDKTLSRGQWVYTGSVFMQDSQYLAQTDGTVIGFVHDPSSIIEHREGLLGHFGELRVNLEIAPPVGTSVTIRVERRSE